MPTQEPKQDLWKSILDDVAAHTSTRHLPERNVVILGNEGTGKSSLVARLQGKKYDPRDHPMGTGLEYSYLEVTDDDTEETLGRLGVYTLDGNTEHAGLLDFVVTPDTVDSVLFVIVVDLSAPWDMISSLTTWIEVVETCLNRLTASQSVASAIEGEEAAEGVVTGDDDDEDADDAERAALQADVDRREALGNKLTKMKADLQRYVQAYKEPGVDAEDDDVLPDLEQGVLTHNLGVPILFVVNKADSIAGLRKEQDYQGQHFDFIQIKLRDLAMSYGAALAYSGRDSDNKDTLYRYLVHRAYGLTFKESAEMTRPEALFIPTGWDTPAKVQVLHGDLSTFSANDEYEDVIKPPPKREVDEEEIVAQDEQEFLRSQHAQQGRSGAEPGGSRRANLSLSKRSTTRAGRTSGPASPSKSTSSVMLPSAGSGTSMPTLSTTSSSSSVSASSTRKPAAMPNLGATLSSSSSTTTTTSSAAAGAANPAANNDVLASFFNSLLQKPAAGGDK
eukprot:m.175323 g.175323  ORF g.175323 m.175323 type:complete len:505 (-) comp16776_c0_seq3:988-2502(-)